MRRGGHEAQKYQRPGVKMRQVSGTNVSRVEWEAKCLLEIRKVVESRAQNQAYIQIPKEIAAL